MKKRKMPALDIADTISVARNADFNRLWGSQILSQVAQNLLNFALIISVYQLASGTRLANISVALLILSFGIPSIVFSAVAGVFVDHWNKKWVLTIVNFLRALLVMGYLVVGNNLWLVFLLAFVISTTTQFFTPAESAAIPELVTQRQLLRANSLFVFTMYASFIAGYSASGPVIAFFGSTGPYLVTAAMFTLAGLLNLMLPSLPSHQELAIPVKRLVRYTLREVSNNWRLIRSEHNLRFPIIQLTIGQTLLGVVMALAPALAVAILNLPLAQTSHFLIIPAGVGLVVGVVAVDQVTRRLGKSRAILAGFFTGALALIAIGSLKGLSPLLAGHQRLLDLYQIGPLVAILVFILGLANAVVSIAAQTILQENTTETTRGKVFGALGMMINIAATLPILFAATLADLFGVSNVILGLGVMLIGIGAAQYLSLARHDRLVTLDR